MFKCEITVWVLNSCLETFLNSHINILKLSVDFFSLYRIPGQYFLRLPRSWQTWKDWETITDQRSLRRHGNDVQCSTLDWLLKQKWKTREIHIKSGVSWKVICQYNFLSFKTLPRQCNWVRNMQKLSIISLQTFCTKVSK